jgi:hypothetical protein
VSFDVGSLLASVVGEVEVRTAVTPPVRIHVARGSSRLGPLLRPTVALRDQHGVVFHTIAPFGPAPELAGYLVAGGVVLLLVGAGFALGRLTS